MGRRAVCINQSLTGKNDHMLITCFICVEV